MVPEPMDTICSKKRSAIMARIKGKNTTPELAVRHAAHKLGLRFRLHRRDLPGCPDLVFARYRLVLFVHGCFWHQHANCKRSNIPKSRLEYWSPKLARNIERDRKNTEELQRLGWKVGMIWECETEAPELLGGRISSLFAL
ncbi:MAG TPA: very short patch repair endonuclease [Stellaceae bacterium]|nr:very short patch repair endonuclease [Stellaceae bacterium]